MGGEADQRPVKIGVILVHGIGEQRRFQHLDGQLRELIRALQGLQQCGKITQVSVDIASTGAAAFQADQDSWNAGPEPSVTVVIRHTLNGVPERTHLLVHEVWWADVNEPYSLAKQFRFWLWGLTVWIHPGRPNANRLGSAKNVAPPHIPDRSPAWDRFRLWMVAVFFMLLGYSVGTIAFLATRLFNLQMPNLLRTIANYISAVKLYNQERRFGPGLFWKREEFLDTVGEAPRVSVRRRMIRAIADVACNRYHRWYILAHSQGTVVAFNGLMETAYAWPGYLDQQRWRRLKYEGMAGLGRIGMHIPEPPIMPRRPAWLNPEDIAYRTRIFSRFQGFLTYGSPLEKFAGLWPALVPISREPAFKPGVAWINVYDPIDPVSGRLKAFHTQPAACCPKARDYGYASGWLLLGAHLTYLTRRREGRDLATMTARWMLTGNNSAFARPNRDRGWKCGTWFTANSVQYHVRSAIAWLTWFLAAAILLALGAIILPMLWDAFLAAADKIQDEAIRLTIGPAP